MTTSTVKSESESAELLFEKYLQREAIVFERELELPNGKRPDFWLGDPHEVVCEVSTINRDFIGEHGLGPTFYEGSPPIRSKISNKSTQGYGTHDLGLAYVIVVKSNSWPLTHLDLANAMVGQATSDLANPFAPIVASGASATVSTDRRPWISATALVDILKPAQQEVHRRLEPDNNLTVQQIWHRVQAAYDELEREGWDITEEQPTLDVVHNPFCHVPVPTGYFQSLYDINYDFTVTTQQPASTGKQEATAKRQSSTLSKCSVTPDPRSAFGSEGSSTTHTQIQIAMTPETVSAAIPLVSQARACKNSLTFFLALQLAVRAALASATARAARCLSGVIDATTDGSTGLVNPTQIPCVAGVLQQPLVELRQALRLAWRPV